MVYAKCFPSDLPVPTLEYSGMSILQEQMLAMCNAMSFQAENLSYTLIVSVLWEMLFCVLRDQH